MQDPQDVSDSKGAAPLVVSQGEIEFRNVFFRYGKNSLFENKNIHIRGGQKVGLVGYSGAGKSTFVNLILRFYALESGSILIDGQDIAHVTLETLRSHVALIPQDPLLFHRSIFENIAFGRSDATEMEVKKAAKEAHAHEFIAKLESGYDTVIGERGTKLSGGERQRIAIARAILSRAPILILDEATSALDSVTERYIQESLDKLMEGRTVIVVAHRLSTLAKMDRLLIFDKGKVIEDGSHEALLAKNGHYAAMWRTQAGGFVAL
jgi:ATP-binding cassette subfamily B protein